MSTSIPRAPQPALIPAGECCPKCGAKSTRDFPLAVECRADGEHGHRGDFLIRPTRAHVAQMTGSD